MTAGIEPSSWDSLLRTKVFLKAPITTPQGGGFKSLNVTTRKTLGQYANVRPCVSYHPFVETKHHVMDVVIVRFMASYTGAMRSNIVRTLSAGSRPVSTLTRPTA